MKELICLSKLANYGDIVRLQIKIISLKIPWSSWTFSMFKV